MGKFKDLTGQKFGRLIVLKQAERKAIPNGKSKIMWKCQCDCGNCKDISGIELRAGRARSCGCLQKEKAVEVNTKHGLYKSRLYGIFHNMHDRCENPNSSSYPKYGGRGISVCKEWKTPDGFEAFVDWSVSHGYSDELSIDRIDNNKGYSPDNCRWTDKFTQANNTRKNVNITWNGETHSLSEWGRIKPNGLNYDTLRSRLRDGWSVERAFSEQKYENSPDSSGHMITVNCETHNVKHWCKKLGISTSTFHRRIASGWSEERAATQLPRRCAK